jgi:hypothetical protein
LPEWEPDALLEQAAASRGLSTEQLRARLRTIADESRETTAHVVFEHARDGNFSDEELGHLERRCQFCQQLIQTINPGDQAVEDFQQHLEARFEYAGVLGSARAPSSPRLGRRVASPVLLAAAAVALASVGGMLWMRAPSAIGGPSASNACAGSSRTHEACSLLTKAAQFEAKGEPEIASAYVVVGLAEAGVTGENLKSVSAAIKPAQRAEAPGNAPSGTPLSAVLLNSAPLVAAQSRFKSGDSAAGYEQILVFLQKWESSGAPAKAFEAAFVEPVRETNARRGSAP